MEKLRKEDQVAFVRFASVYRNFKDISEFVQEVQPMLTQRGGPATEKGKGADPRQGSGG